MRDWNKSGWVRLHRKIEDNPLYFLEPFTKAQAWIDLFLNANHRDGEISIRGNIIIIKRGQIGWSELTMTKRWKWSRNKVRLFLSYLENKGQQITQEKSALTTVITILNYDRHQRDGTTEGTTEGQQKVHKQECKELKNNTTVAKATGGIKLNNEIHPMKELEEPTYESETKPKRKSKHGSKTMAVLAYAYAKASGADLSKPINGSSWLKPLSEIYDYFDKDADAAVEYITNAVKHYESITLKDGSKCKYSIRTIQNVQDVLRNMTENKPDEKNLIYF